MILNRQDGLHLGITVFLLLLVVPCNLSELWIKSKSKSKSVYLSVCLGSPLLYSGLKGQLSQGFEALQGRAEICGKVRWMAAMLLLPLPLASVCCPFRPCNNREIRRKRKRKMWGKRKRKRKKKRWGRKKRKMRIGRRKLIKSIYKQRPKTGTCIARIKVIAPNKKCKR